jgi:hypothetical protein
MKYGRATTYVPALAPAVLLNAGVGDTGQPGYGKDAGRDRIVRHSPCQRVHPRRKGK